MTADARWRDAALSRPGYATYANTVAETPSWWTRHDPTTPTTPPPPAVVTAAPLVEASPAERAQERTEDHSAPFRWWRAARAIAARR